jgi:hypothetical protein
VDRGRSTSKRKVDSGVDEPEETVDNRGREGGGDLTRVRGKQDASVAGISNGFPGRQYAPDAHGAHDMAHEQSTVTVDRANSQGGKQGADAANVGNGSVGGKDADGENTSEARASMGDASVTNIGNGENSPSAEEGPSSTREVVMGEETQPEDAGGAEPERRGGDPPPADTAPPEGVLQGGVGHGAPPTGDRSGDLRTEDCAKAGGEPCDAHPGDAVAAGDNASPNLHGPRLPPRKSAQSGPHKAVLAEGDKRPANLSGPGLAPQTFRQSECDRKPAQDVLTEGVNGSQNSHGPRLPPRKSAKSECGRREGGDVPAESGDGSPNNHGPRGPAGKLPQAERPPTHEDTVMEDAIGTPNSHGPRLPPRQSSRSKRPRAGGHVAADSASESQISHSPCLPVRKSPRSVTRRACGDMLADAYRVVRREVTPCSSTGGGRRATPQADAVAPASPAPRPTAPRLPGVKRAATGDAVGPTSPVAARSTPSGREGAEGVDTPGGSPRAHCERVSRQRGTPPGSDIKRHGDSRGVLTGARSPVRKNLEQTSFSTRIPDSLDWSLDEAVSPRGVSSVARQGSIERGLRRESHREGEREEAPSLDDRPRRTEAAGVAGLVGDISMGHDEGSPERESVPPSPPPLLPTQGSAEALGGTDLEAADGLPLPMPGQSHHAPTDETGKKRKVPAGESPDGFDPLTACSQSDSSPPPKKQRQGKEEAGATGHPSMLAIPLNGFGKPSADTNVVDTQGLRVVAPALLHNGGLLQNERAASAPALREMEDKYPLNEEPPRVAASKDGVLASAPAHQHKGVDGRTASGACGPHMGEEAGPMSAADKVQGRPADGGRKKAAGSADVAESEGPVQGQAIDGPTDSEVQVGPQTIPVSISFVCTVMSTQYQELKLYCNPNCSPVSRRSLGIQDQSSQPRHMFLACQVFFIIISIEHCIHDTDTFFNFPPLSLVKTLYYCDGPGAGIDTAYGHPQDSMSYPFGGQPPPMRHTVQT